VLQFENFNFEFTFVIFCNIILNDMIPLCRVAIAGGRGLLSASTGPDASDDRRTAIKQTQKTNIMTHKLIQLILTLSNYCFINF